VFPSLHLRTETVPTKRCFLVILEYRTTDQIQGPTDLGINAAINTLFRTGVLLHKTVSTFAYSATFLHSFASIETSIPVEPTSRTENLLVISGYEARTARLEFRLYTKLLVNSTSHVIS
jgi:hypothetical protein